jgi:hypothetical protein
LDTARESSPDEVARLRRCLNDLVGIMALPALWTGGASQDIAGTLMDALVGTLRPAFVFVRLNSADAGPFTETARIAIPWEGVTGAQEIGHFLDVSLGDLPREWPSHAQVRIESAEFVVASSRLGIDGEIGIVVVGSQRIDFPQQTERLVLDVAANQAAIGLEQQRKLAEQQRVSRKLDERVAQRTSELAAANERLKESERDSKLIVDSIPGLIAVLNVDGEIESASRPLLDYYGKTLGEVREWASGDAVHAEDRMEVDQKLAQAFTAGDPIELEARLRRFDGTYRWFQIRGRPLRDPQGRILRWYFLQTDVDERKRAEDALRSSEHDLKTIINTIPGVAWSARPDGSADFLNRTYLDYTGLTAEEGTGWGWTAAVHPDDLNHLLTEWEDSTATGLSREVEARLRQHDGEYRWFLFRSNALRDEEGKIVKWYGTNTDIEDRKRSEVHLRRNEQFLSKAQRLSATGSFSWRVETDELMFSEEASRIFGFEPHAPVTLQMIASRIHPDDLPLLAARQDAARGLSAAQDYEIRVRMPDGSLKYLHTTSDLTQDVNGSQEYVGAIQDVTQRRLAREALNKAQSELAHVARVTALSALTASIAHEINQPLSGIITNAGTCVRMLQGDPPNVEGARETARRTIRDGNRVSDVISRLRALFSKKEFTLEPLDLNEATTEVLALSLNDLQRNQVIVQTEFAGGLAPVAGDRIQLQQVILNLVRNASDAMAQIDDRPRRLSIRTESLENGYVRLSVRDSGVGFEGQLIEKLFDSFYTTKSGGMGIGLSVSRSIIERHQGRLWAEPNDGPGATFSFSVPCA